MINPLPLPAQHPLNVQFNWQKYFEAFQEEHGQGLEYKGRLLFQDGWMYSRTDHSGPEYAPPQDPEKLAKLQRAYWLIRWNIARAELIAVNTAYLALKEAARIRSAPIYVTTFMRDEQGKMTKDVGPVDFGVFEGRLEYCLEEFATCEAMLIRLDPTRAKQYELHAEHR